MLRTALSISFLALVAASPTQAQDANAARNAQNWEVFHKLYPARAIAAKEEGAVGFKVTIDGKGYVTECRVTHSSGHPLLDEETCNLVTMHAQFQPTAPGSASQIHTSDGIIAWKLPASTTVLATPTKSASSDLDTVVCKKSIRTGTIGGVERTCMTKRAWGKQTDELREPWEELQGRKGMTNGR
jgi:protein TonB